MILYGHTACGKSCIASSFLAGSKTIKNIGGGKLNCTENIYYNDL